MKMKAWTLDTPALITERPLHLREVPVPSPAEDEVLLRVNACGICRTDLHVVEGELAAHRSPLVPGHQIVGRVATVGASVKDFAIGDRVGVAWLANSAQHGLVMPKTNPRSSIMLRLFSRRQVNLFRLRSR
jgi:propanol-preferring alcohol dehydrogenase